jgi:ubiquinone/menaquinone biosynthesis C-methylase UbiE
MIDKAKENAVKYGFKNVDFRKGEIEDLPVESNSVNKIISNCVVNLATDKAQVFREALRVLKPEGRMYISDIVLLEELSEEIRTNPELISGCVSNAMLRDQFLELIESCGLKYNIIEEDREISKKQYKGIALESLKLEIYKPAAVVVDSTTKV